MLVVRFCVDKNRGTRKVGHCDLRVEQTRSPASLLRLEAIRCWAFLKFGSGMPLAAHDLGEGSRVFSQLGFCVSGTGRMSTVVRKVNQFAHMQLERKLSFRCHLTCWWTNKKAAEMASRSQEAGGYWKNRGSTILLVFTARTRKDILSDFHTERFFL